LTVACYVDITHSVYVLSCNSTTRRKCGGDVL